MSSPFFVRSASLICAIAVALFPLFVSMSSAQTKSDPEVVFNTESLIYHRASCSAARRCTKNCVVIRLSEARKRQGRACKICGGPIVTDVLITAPRLPTRLALARVHSQHVAQRY